ncbi:MAG: FAD-dependent oxidoreductase [Nannocystaceae bacterium]
MIDWLIVGGGIHGTHLSLALTRRARVPAAKVRVLDPHARPLAAWDRCVESVGMPFLRSPDAHHLDLAAPSLHLYADARRAPRVRRFYRPSVELFREHAEAVIRANELESLRLRGSALAIRRGPRGLLVECDRGQVSARRVVLAIGGGAPRWPAWAQALLDDRGDLTRAIDHVLAPSYSVATTMAAARVVVIGGGLSAVQAAIAASRGRSAPVHLVSRRPVRVADFDPDTCWAGERCLRRLWRLGDPSARRALVDGARQRATVPPDVARQLVLALRRGRVVQTIDEVVRASPAVDGSIAMTCTKGQVICSDRVVLATGVDERRPGPWLDAVAEALSLPVGPRGFPCVDRRLRWAEGLHVSGVLAELELGPAAGNIVGARLAARRLLKEAA